MASKVTPSTPGAPSFCLAISYAARRVSTLQTWTYRPQKRQDGSAFALTYILRLRSCKPMDAFVISCLPLGWRHCKWQGPSLHGHYSASSLVRAHPPPSRLRPTSRGRRLYGLPCSGDFSSGRGGLLQLLSMSWSPCCRFHPAEVNSRIGQFSAGHSAFALRLQALGDTHFRGQSCSNAGLCSLGFSTRCSAPGGDRNAHRSDVRWCGSPEGNSTGGRQRMRPRLPGDDRVLLRSSKRPQHLAPGVSRLLKGCDARDGDGDRSQARLGGQAAEIGDGAAAQSADSRDPALGYEPLRGLAACRPFGVDDT